jgi:hypothetical protein
MRISAKTKVIEHLFMTHWDAATGQLTQSVMTMQDVLQAIEHCNNCFGTKLSRRNPANFMKDIVRSAAASDHWPQELKTRGYTAKQRTGAGDVLEFVPYPPGCTEPFPDVYRPTAGTTRHKVESASMSLEAKKLGRADEAWSIQTAVKLRIIETHLAIYSSLPVVEVAHLQMSVKLRKAEIDGLFLARCENPPGTLFNVIITCEAKQARERILEGQIIEQVRAAFATTATHLGVDTVVPIGIRVVKKIGFYVVEFAPVTRVAATTLHTLSVASEVLYELHPSVRGI